MKCVSVPILVEYRFLDFVSQETVTYDHRLKRIGHPVRSAIHKLEIGGLVVRWVTTGEYLLLYVYFFSSFFFSMIPM
jgi:hypothetical protein